MEQKSIKQNKIYTFHLSNLMLYPLQSIISIFLIFHFLYKPPLNPPFYIEAYIPILTKFNTKIQEFKSFFKFLALIISFQSQSMQEVEFQQIQISPAFHAPTSNPFSSLSDQKALSKTILSQDIELVDKEIAKINKFSQGVSSVITKLNKSQQECTQSIDSLRKESSQLEENIASYQNSLNSNNVKNIQNQIQSNKKRYITLWEERIMISEKLKIKNLQQIEIEDRKSIANEFFKWIVVVIYGENESKFYLPNFKAQLFEKDDGKDFRERLGKINASNAKDQQIHKAKDFLQKYSEIVGCEEIQSAKIEAQSLKKVVQIFIECNELAKKSSELEKSIEQDKEKTLQKDEQAMKWKARHEALQQRVEVLNQYMETMRNTEKQLKEQETIHQNKLAILKEIMSKLKKGQPLTQTELDKLAES